MKITIIKSRTPEITKELLLVWESSVKATHNFLSDGEIEKIKLYVPQAIQNVQHLAVAEYENAKVAAFLGVENKRIEMLFVAPEKRGLGIGKALINFAFDTFGADEVTVNEQNAQAVGFYGRMGFKTYKRTDLDEQGNAYPLLYMHI